MSPRAPSGMTLTAEQLKMFLKLHNMTSLSTRQDHGTPADRFGVRTRGFEELAVQLISSALSVRRLMLR
jgi:hypothetical protein